MSKGRLTALASVVMLVALTGGAAGLSVASGPLSAQYVAAGSECAVPSNILTLRGAYQAPDRYEEVDEDYATFVVVGPAVYARADGANTWTVEKLEADPAGEIPKAWLLPLVGHPSVTRVGSVYRSAMYSIVVTHGANGYMYFNGTVKMVTRAGNVVSEDVAGTVTNDKELGSGVPSPACGT